MKAKMAIKPDLKTKLVPKIYFHPPVKIFWDWRHQKLGKNKNELVCNKRMDFSLPSFCFREYLETIFLKSFANPGIFQSWRRQ